MLCGLCKHHLHASKITVRTYSRDAHVLSYVFSPAGGTLWEERAPLSNITGAGRCEFVHSLLYCFGGSLGAGMATVNTLNVSARALLDTKYRCHGMYLQHARCLFDRSSAPLQIYDPQTDTWTPGSPMPEELDHSASVVFEDRIWSTSGRCSSPLPLTR